MKHITLTVLAFTFITSLVNAQAKFQSANLKTVEKAGKLDRGGNTLDKFKELLSGKKNAEKRKKTVSVLVP